MKKIKVLQIIDQLGGGGAERVVVEMVTHFPSNYEVLVCATRQRGNFKYADLLESHNVPVVNLNRIYRYDLSGFLRLRKLIADYKPDIVHTHKYGSNVWGRVLRLFVRIPVLVCHEHTWSYTPQEGRTRIFINRLLSPLSDAIIAVSEMDREKLVSIEKLPEKKIMVVYNGIDFSRMEGYVSRSEFRSALSIGKETIVAAIVGKLLPQKGHTVLFEALRILQAQGKLEEFCLLVVGEGCLEAELRKNVAELNLEGVVKFLGFRKDINSVLNAVDLVVMPSLFEGHPMALLESMAVGRPVLATDVGGIPEVITSGETGLLVPPLSPELFAKGLYRLIADEDLRKRLGQSASIHVRANFSIDEAVKQYIKIYEALL